MRFPEVCECKENGHCPHLSVSVTNGIREHCRTNKRYRLSRVGVPDEQLPADDPPRSPGLIRKAITFGKALIQHAWNGFPKPSQEEVDRRRAICERCELRVNGACTVCGCNTNKKTSWLLQRCPHPAGDRWALSLPIVDADHYSALRMQLADCLPSDEEMRAGLKAVAERRTAMPATMSGRGIVFAAGGPRFMCGVWTSVGMLRWLKCDYPVEVWYNGDLPNEFHDHYPELFKGLGVTFRDAAAELRRLGIKRRTTLDGWPLKPLAYLLSSFQEVLGLDADCYPVLDPRPLFDDPRYRKLGAIFWPDRGNHKNGAPLEPGQWHRFGLADRRTPGIESGQILIDKAKHWHSLSVVAWLNDHHDYCYLPDGPAGLYGDKDTFAIGFHAVDEWGGAKTGTPYVQAPPTRWLHVAFMQHDLNGGTMFIHRCQDKPRIETYQYGTKQRAADQMIRCDKAGGKIPEFAHEWKVFDLVHEYSRKLAGAEIIAKQIADMRAFMASIGEPPKWYGRGIVVTTSSAFAGGAYVLLRMLQHVGCRLPVQIWYREPDRPHPIFREFPFVELRSFQDFAAACETHYRQYQHYFAIRNSGWRDVIYLDCDLYPVEDITFLGLNIRDGFATWQDLDSSTAFAPELYGLSGSRGFQPQGGIKIVDVETAWQALRLTEWLCMNEAFYFPGQAGDQSQLRAAWLLYSLQPHNFGKVEHVAGKALIHACDGKPMFVHRVGCKMGFEEGCRIDSLPMEDIAWSYFEEWLNISNHHSA